MALTSAGSNPGTLSDPYLIFNSADFDDIQNYDSDLSTIYFEVQNEINYEGGTPVRNLDFYGDLNLGGYKVKGIGGVAPELFRIIHGKVHNGEFSFDIVGSGEDINIILVISTNGGFEKVKFSGSISTTGTGRIRFIQTPNYQSIIKDVISTMNLTTVDGLCSFSGAGSGSAFFTNIIIAGEHRATGLGTAYALSNSGKDEKNCFYDSTKNLAISDATSATPKSTTELQTLATYTDDVATTGLETPVYDMVDEVNHVAQTWFLPYGDDYPRLSFEVKSSATLNGITKDGVLQQGAYVKVTAYDDYTMATGEQEVGLYVTDIDGIVGIPLADIPAGKKLFIAPHNNDTGVTSSDQGKFVTDVF